MCSTMHMLRPCSHHAHTCTVTKQGATEWWYLSLPPGTLISYFQWNGMRLGIDILVQIHTHIATHRHTRHTRHTHVYIHTQHTHTTYTCIHTYTRIHNTFIHATNLCMQHIHAHTHTQYTHACLLHLNLSYTLHELVLNKEGWSRTKTLALRRLTSKR